MHDEHEGARRRHRERMKTEEAKTAYSRRQHFGETPFAVMKVSLDLRRFLLRGIVGVGQEWRWAATALPDPTGHEAYARLDRALLDYRARRAGPEGEPFAATPIYGTNRIAESDFSPPKENRGRRDVEEGFGTIARLNEVQRLIVLRSAAALAMLLPEIEREEAADPANPAFPLARGRALLLVLDRPGEAVAALEKAARLGYASPDLARMIEAARERAR
jgi:hypothetical protein